MGVWQAVTVQLAKKLPNISKPCPLPPYPSLQDGYLSPNQLSLAKQQMYSLLEEVRREAVPLVDAFDIPDGMLNSVLGRYDGDVYTHLYEWAQKAPRNMKQV